MFDNLVVQLSMLLSLNAIITFVVAIKRPFLDRRDNLRVIISELLMLIASVFLYFYEQDTEEDEEIRLNSFYAVIYLFLVNVIVHDVFLFIELIFPLIVEIYERLTHKIKEK